MKLSLVAIGRRENRYAREFVEHYLALGFHHIFICDNNHDREEHFEDVLQDFIDRGQVSIHDYRNRRGVQCQAYNDIYRDYHGAYDWMAFFDFDEFLCLQEGLSLKDWLSRFGSAGADDILVNWMCYGDCGMLHDDGRPLMERFTEPLPFDKPVQYEFPNNDHVKSIVRCTLDGVHFRRNPHVPDNVEHCHTAGGRPCEASPFQPYDFSVAHLKHFATKTISEWMANKWQKGTANKPTIGHFRDVYQGRFFKYNEATQEKLCYQQTFERISAMGITAVIVNYNTTRLTQCAIRSLRKHSPGVSVIVFDNSDRERLPSMDGVEILDNTGGQIIDFRRMLDCYPRKVDVGNDWASAKHCATVNWLISRRRTPFLLMDSDVLVRQDISPLWDTTKVFTGEIRPHRSAFRITIDRVLPFLCFLNVPMIKHHGVTYFNPQKMWALTDKRPHQAYDTGCWFLEDVKSRRLPYTELSIDPYIIHFGHGSWREKNAEEWLEENKDLWL